MVLKMRRVGASSPVAVQARRRRGLDALFAYKQRKGRANQIPEFVTKVRIDTPQEILYYENGGILQYVLRSLVVKN